MGRKTHGPYLVAAIEYNDLEKVSDILAKHFRDRKQIKELLVSEVPRLANEYTEVPLLLAASLPDPAIIKFLVLRHEVNVNHTHEYGFVKHKKLKTALLVAVRLGHYDTVDVILSMNGDPNIADHKGRRPLHHAVRRADYRMAKLLLSRGAQCNDVDIAGNTPLHVATIFGHTELVKLLLHHGGDVYKKGQHGAIPIHMAAREGHANLVRLFCQHEVNANVKVPCYDSKDKAPIHVAAERGHAETVFALLECCHASVDVKDSEGETPLHSCVINEYDPLGMKSKDDYTETAKVLLNRGADVNLRNARGETALHLAARNEFQKVIEVLVLAGCDPLINDNDKNKAIDLVSDDDTVSKQTLKGAMQDRERFLNDAFEVRSKGFVTSIQPQLPLSIKSQSLTSMPLLNSSLVSNSLVNSSLLNNSLLNNSLINNSLMNNVQSMNSNVTRTVSNPGLFGPQMSPLVLSDDGYLNPLRSFNPALTPISNMSQGSIFSQGSNSDVPRSFTIREEDETNSQSKHPSISAMSDRISQISKNSSNQRILNGNKLPSSYHPSETSSLWDVTPNASISTYNFDEHEVELLQKLKNAERSAATKTGATNGLKQTKVEPEKSKKPLRFVAVNKAADGGEAVLSPEEVSEEDTFFDDESFDTISDSWVEGSTQTQPSPEENAVMEMSGSQASLQGWLENQVERSRKHGKSKNEKTESAAPSRPLARVRHPSASSTETVKRRDPPPLPVEAKNTKKTKTKNQNSIPNPDTNKVIEVQIDDTQIPGQTIFRVIPVNPPGPARMEVVSTRSAKKAISQFSDNAFVDMLSQSDFSWVDSVSQCSDYTDSQLSTASSAQPGKNSKSFVFVRHGNSKGHRWEKTVKPSSKTKPKGSQMSKNGVTTSNRQFTQGNKMSGKRESDRKKRVQPTVLDHRDSSDSSDISDDDTVVDARQVNKSRKVQSSQTSQAVMKKGTSPAPNSILKNTSPQQTTSPTFLYPVQSQMVKQLPMSSAPPVLLFQRPNSVADPKDLMSKDYLFLKTMSNLNSASAEDVLDHIGLKPAIQSSFSAPAGGNYLLNASAVSELSPGSENRLSGSSFGGADFTNPLTLQSYSQSLGYPLQSLNPLDVMQLELKRQHDFQMQQLEYRRQQEIQMQQFQQQRAELSRYQELQRQQQMMLEHEMLRQQQQQQVNMHPKKRNAETVGSRSVQPSSQLYEELPDGSSEKHVSIGAEEYIPDDGSSTGKNFRTLSYNGDGRLGCTLKGGNNTGVYVSALDDGSAARRGGLNVGDKILKVNGCPVKDKTKEEVAQSLQTTGQLRLSLEFNSMRYNSVVSSDRPGDLFHVLAHFNHTATKKDELTVREGEVFLISDTLPDDHAGFWLAKKVRSCTTSEVDQVGLIPNKQAAELILVKKDLTETKNSDKRNGPFMRSFRRAKSMERINKGKETQALSAAGMNVIAYERVMQTTENVRRPVVIMGLFCGSVRDMLVRDSPGLFEVPAVEVERRNDQENGSTADTTPVVNERVIQAIRNKDKHCLMIVSPKAIEYLKEKTNLNPIVIYMSPVSKNVVKIMHAKFEPNVNRKPGFMFDEAMKFEKANAGIFSAIVPYKTDATWFSLLKDTIDRIQKLPKWVAMKEETDSDEAERDSPDIIRTTKRGSGGCDTERHRISKSTEDIPDQIQDLLNRHTYGKVQRPSRSRGENGRRDFASREVNSTSRSELVVNGNGDDGDILKYLNDNERSFDETETHLSRRQKRKDEGQIILSSFKRNNNSPRNDVTEKRNAKNSSNKETPL